MEPLQGDKLRIIWEMYESYIPIDRWILILREAIEAHMENGNEGWNSTPLLQNSQHDLLSLRVASIMGKSPDAARPHSLLRRSGNKLRTDDKFIRKFEIPGFSIRTILRRTRHDTTTAHSPYP